jgi:poly(A) polymerase
MMILPKKTFNNTDAIFQLDIPYELLDRDALNIIDRLDRRGYFSFFVGGCIRDLLLNQSPKDFDVVTLARPKEIKNLFRNCRLIGRRFQLAHLIYSGQKIIEVATFRKQPNAKRSMSGELIVDDNEFGTPQTDVNRRDFTINAMLYDPVRHLLIDEKDGLSDLESRFIRCIGEPVSRMREDPIRMLRAIRLASRLGFEIEESLSHAIKSERFELVKSAHPRFQQELTRMLQSGYAQKAFQLMDEYGVIELLVPELFAFWQQNQEAQHKSMQLLHALDLSEPETFDEPLLYTCLFWPIFQNLTQLGTSVFKANEEYALRLFAPFAIRIGLSLKTLTFMAKIFAFHVLVDQQQTCDQKGYAYHLSMKFLAIRSKYETLASVDLYMPKQIEKKKPKKPIRRKTT